MTWSISQVAEKTGLSPHTLRWYERIGLLGPVHRSSDGRRKFTDQDLDWLSLISKLRDTGMPLKDIHRYAELVRSGAGEAERLTLLERHRIEVRKALARQQECLTLLDKKIEFYSGQVDTATEGNQQCDPYNLATLPSPPRASAAWA